MLRGKYFCARTGRHGEKEMDKYRGVHCTSFTSSHCTGFFIWKLVQYICEKYNCMDIFSFDILEPVKMGFFNNRKKIIADNLTILASRHYGCRMVTWVLNFSWYYN